MTRTVYTDADGLGLAPWIIPVLTSVGATVAGALTTRLLSGPSSPSQKDIEAQMKLQTQLDIQRMMAAQQVQQQQTSELGSYLLPALGVVALVMLLR